MLENRIEPYKSIQKRPTRTFKKLEIEGNTLFYCPNMIGICKTTENNILNYLDCKVLEASLDYTIVEIKKFKLIETEMNSCN